MKKVKDLPKPLEDAIHRYAMRGNYKMVGSSATRGMLYWSDIDINNKLHGRAETLASHFSKVAKIKDDVIWRELKAGLDTRFDTESKLLSSPLITPKEKQKIKKLKGLEKEEYIRKFYVLRWTRQEVAQGYKELRKGRKLLKDAIQDDTILKLDIIVPMGSDFLDVSEMYVYKQKEQDESQIRKDLQDDIDYYKSTDTLKSLKRLYSLFKLERDSKKMELLNQFFNSWVGALNKCISDLELLQEISKTHNVQSAMDDVKLRLGNIKQVPLKYVHKPSPELLRKIVNTASKQFILSDLAEEEMLRVEKAQP